MGLKQVGEQQVNGKKGWRIGAILWLVCMLAAACNLVAGDEARRIALRSTQTTQPTVAPKDLLTPIPQDDAGAIVPIPTGITLVYQSPVAGATNPAAFPTANATIDPAAVSNPCNQLRVYAGTDPGNTLRLRAEPRSNASIVYLIPNHATVIAVPSSGEITAGGYHWRNVIYTAPDGSNYVGWAARDANPLFVTLVADESC
jgi:hypothetical protein